MLRITSGSSQSSNSLIVRTTGDSSGVTSHQRPLGVTVISAFFAVGATISALTCVMLLVPGSLLDGLWRLNPQAHNGFATMGIRAVVLMLAVSASCGTAAVGLFRRTLWGLWTAVAVLGINLLGDTLNFLIRNDWRTLIGMPVGALLIFYLLSQRSVFTR